MDDITKNQAEEPEKRGKGNSKVRGSKKKYYIWGFIIFFLIAGITGINFAQKMKKMHDGGPLMFMMNKVTKDLNLTDQQKADIEKIKQEIKAKRESMKKERENRGTMFDDFSNAFKQDKLDKETLKSLEQKREANRQEMKEFMMDELVKFHDVLTPEQRTQVVDKMKQMREKMKERFKNRKDKKDKKFDYPPENH